MSRMEKITLNTGHEWAIGYHTIPRWCEIESDSEVVIPVDQLTGLSLEQIGAFVLEAVGAARELAIEAEVEQEAKYAGQLRRNIVTPATPGYIYLIYGEGTAWHKIGHSATPTVRLKQLGTQGPFVHRLIHSFAVDDMVSAESALHSYFAKKRAEGEWFQLNADDVAMFTRLDCRTVNDLLAVLAG